MKKLFAILLTVCLVASMLPVQTFAEQDQTETLAAHDDATHICEHCVAAGAADTTPTWTAWGEGKTKLPAADGHYYLTADLHVTAATVTSGHIVLCLNGHTVTANGTNGSTADRFYNLQNTASLTILDCNASGEGDSYKAGKFTGASNIAFNTSNSSSTKSTGTITVYDGIFEKNVSAVTGNVFMITGSANLYVYGGRFAENEATGKGAGVIYGNTGSNYIYLENAVFYKNEAGYGGVVYHAGNKVAAVPITVEVVNCTFDSNKSTSSTGAALCFGGNAVVSVEGSTFTGNTANTAGGAIRVTGTTSSLTVKDSTMTGNTGKAGAGAIWAGGPVSLENVTIKNNTSKGTDIIGGMGAVTLGDKDASTKAAQVLTIKGNTQILDNTDGADAQRNVHMTNGTDKIAAENLDATAKISVAGAKGDVLSDVLANAETVKGNFTADNGELSVGVQDGKLVLVDKASEPVVPPAPPHDHTCEHCASATADWKPWGDNGETTLPTADGHYYLTQDLYVTNGDITSGHVVLCLNGKTVTANGTDGDPADRFYQMKTTGSLSIVDCTATGEGDSYKAGTMTGGSASAIMYNSATSTEGTVNIYDGIFTDNHRDSSGGVICVQGKGKLNIYGGQFIDNSTGASGGVLYVGGANNPTHIENALFKGNTAATSGGVLYNNKGTVTLKNVTMTRNSAPSAGVIVSLGKITYQDTTITGNTTISGDYGALHHYNSSSTATVELIGKTVIDDNFYGDPVEGKERNLWLRNHSYKVSANGLTAGAMIGLSWDSGKVTATNGNQYITTKLSGFDPLPYFSLDKDGYLLKVVDGGASYGDRMVIQEKPDHPHKVCNDAACADHAEINFKNWNDAKSLPDSGSINLQTDVVLTSAVSVAGKLNICLNGHTITVNKANTRAFALDAGDELNITDCQGSGKITGGSRTYGGAVNVGRGAVMNLYAGTITGNTALGEEGGAIYVAGGNDTTKAGAIFNMYGGEISNNTARLGAAVRVTNPAGAGEKAQFNMYGGKISGNSNTGTSTSNYAAIVADKAVVKLLGGEISGNESATYGAVYTTANTDLTLGGDIKILNNTVAGKAANLYLAGDGKFKAEGLNEKALVAVSTEKYDRFISEAAADCTKNFASDSAYRTITYKDGALYLGVTTEHQHCVCAGTSTLGCEHGTLVWTAWESNNSLPLKSGNYYLLEDVQLKDVQWIKNLNVNLCLNGHTVTAADGKRLFSTQETTVMSVTDCVGTGKLTGGSSTYGGAIGVQAGSTLNLFGGTITGNKSTDKKIGQGGAIYLQAGSPVGGTLNMYGGKITGNEATWGGAIYAKKNSKINIYGGTISENTASTYGGAVYACEGITTDILGGTFQKNYAKTGGGAVYVTGANSVLNMKNATFTNNSIGGYAGGAIFAQSSGTKVTVDGCSFTGNSAKAGGAIYASGSTTWSVDNSYFTGNYAEQGACIYEQRATVTIGKVTMEKNEAKSRAAGVYAKAGEVTMDGIVIKNNTSAGSGTAITTGSDVVDDITVYPTVHFVSGTISGNKGNSGVVLLQSKTVFNMKGGTISGNTTSYAGGVYVSTNATFNMSGGTISNNTTKNNGGAIYALRSTVNLSGGTISGNKATKMGGGIFLSGAKLTMTGGSIVNNKTDTGTGGGGIATGVATASGVKYVPSIRISGGSVSNNYGRHGGAILFQGNDKTVITITGGQFHNNEGKVDGGAFYISTNTKLTMTGGSVKGNNCTGRAGAFFFNNSIGEISNLTVTDNKAGSSGGAICINGKKANITIKDSSFSGHQGASGGTICHQGNAVLLLENVKITDSRSENNGGAVYLSNNITATFNNVTVTDAKSEKVGGGMYWGNNAVVKGNGLVIENCEAMNDGGGIYSRSGSAILDNVKIVGNKAVRWGGGIILYRPAMQGVSGSGDYKTGHIFTNLEVRNNTTNEQGGGIWSDAGSKLVLDGAVITGNTAGLEGGGIWSQGDLTMRNMDVNGNNAGGEGYAVYLMDAKYDGHSYAAGVNKMSGNVKIENNQSGDLYMGNTTTIIVEQAGMGQETCIHVTLDKGVLTNRVFGKYNYEGGNLEYTITYGDRSFTDPEYDPECASEQKVETPAQESAGDIWLYAGLGAFVLIVAAVVILLLKKRKAPEKTNKE